jgi:hypothetical protein
MTLDLRESAAIVNNGCLAKKTGIMFNVDCEKMQLIHVDVGVRKS